MKKENAPYKFIAITVYVHHAMVEFKDLWGIVFNTELNGFYPISILNDLSVYHFHEARENNLKSVSLTFSFRCNAVQLKFMKILRYILNADLLDFLSISTCYLLNEIKASCMTLPHTGFLCYYGQPLMSPLALPKKYENFLLLTYPQFLLVLESNVYRLRLIEPRLQLFVGSELFLSSEQIFVGRSTLLCQALLAEKLSFDRRRTLLSLSLRPKLMVVWQKETKLPIEEFLSVCKDI